MSTWVVAVIVIGVDILSAVGAYALGLFVGRRG